jgi:RNA polymerase sigma-70 factor, ECF subfamily
MTKLSPYLSAACDTWVTRRECLWVAPFSSLLLRPGPETSIDATRLAGLAWLAMWRVESRCAESFNTKSGDRETIAQRSRLKTSGVGTETEALLVSAICASDESGLRAAVDKYGAFVHGAAFQILRDPMLAEEVAQDTFMMLWRKPRVYNPHRGSLKAFLTAVARNKAIDVVRHEQVIRAKESPAVEMTWLETAMPTDPSDGEDGITIRTAVKSLPRLKKEALFLAYFRGLTYREVSEVLDIPEGTVKTRIRDALIRLRSSMLT